MSDQLIAAPDAAPAGKPVWRLWKWVGLVVFALLLLLKRWLPDLIVVLGTLYGVVAALNLAFHGARILKDRLFWRVRNRVAGSLVFVGVIPLILILGTVVAALYLLAGQLSSRFIERALEGYEQELAAIHTELSQRVVDVSAEALSRDLEPSLASFRDRFPRMAVRLARRSSDGSFTVGWRHDPTSFLPTSEVYPAQKWLRADGTFQGLLRWDRLAFLAVSKPLVRFPGYWLDVSAPLDSNIASRILAEHSIYVGFAGVGTVKLTVSQSEVRVDTESPEMEKTVDSEVESMLSDLEKKKAEDKRRKIRWFMLVSCPDYTSGEETPAGLAAISAPVGVLYQTYLGGAFQQGRVVLLLLYILFGLFAAVELVSLIVGVMISRRVTKSVDDMYRGILALQKGDLQHRIPVRKSDQLGLLAHSFNQMTGSITRRVEEVSEKKRLEQELEIAREVQATLFPKQLPRPRGMEVFGGCEPARVVSGDYYDFIIEDEARLHIVVGDISGKGISAALLMANLQAAMRNQLLRFQHSAPDQLEKGLAELMARLNAQIFANSPSGKYATLFAARYDAETRSLCYCNAGHLPPLVLCNGSLSRLEVGGTVLGLFETAQYQAATVRVEPGSIIAVYTDGVTEAPNDSDEEFGEDRLIESLRESRDGSPEDIYRAVTGRLGRWQGSLKQHDDITLIVAKVS